MEPRGVHNPRRHSRAQAVAQLLPSLPIHTVVDLGAGLCPLQPWLPPDWSYLGYDRTPLLPEVQPLVLPDQLPTIEDPRHTAITLLGCLEDLELEMLIPRLPERARFLVCSYHPLSRRFPLLAREQRGWASHLRHRDLMQLLTEHYRKVQFIPYSKRQRLYRCEG